jgi:hypothetical protein
MQPLSTRGRDEPALVLTRQQTRPLGDRDEVIGGGGIVDDPVLDQAAAVGGARACRNRCGRTGA